MEKQVKEEVIAEVEVLKSRFIAYFFPCNKKEDFLNRLEILKKENQKARHFVYAYIIGNEKRGYDDKEPKGSAGLPLLKELEKNSLVNSAVIVVRYFGGSLLGSGRLLRSYLKAYEEVFLKAKFVEINELKLVSALVDYETFDTFKNYLKINHFNILRTEFNDKISIDFIVPLDFKKIDDSFYKNVSIIKIEEYLERKEID